MWLSRGGKSTNDIWQYKCFIFYSSVFSAGAAAFMAEAEGLIGPSDRGSPQVAVLFSP
jgi:hypothetical protein